MRINAAVTAAVSLSLTTLAGLPVLAQDGATASSAVLDEVVVTARKREESLQDVPLAVTALTAEAIENRQVQSIDDIAKFAPGLVFSKSFGRSTERPVVRGLASILAGTNPTVETGVAYFVDGVYYPGDIQSLDMNDVQRVEVIRGPQSALYGRNTYSGAINFITRSPGEELAGSANVNFDGDERQVAIRVNGPILSDKLSGGISARYYDFDGQWLNTLTGRTIGNEETRSISASLNFTPTENLEFRLRLQHNDDDDGTRPLFLQSGGDNNCFPGSRSLGSYRSTSTNNQNQWFCGEVQPGRIALNDAPVTQTAVPVSGIPSTLLVASTGGVYDTRQGVAFSGVERTLDVATLLASWDIAGSGYRLVTAGGVRAEDRKTGSDSDHSSVNIIGAPVAGVQPQANGAASDLDEFRDWSAEIKIESPQEARFRWLLGLYHFEFQRDAYRVDFVSLNGQDNPVGISDITNNAVFGSAEFDFTDRLTATVEMRRAKEYKTQTDYATRANIQQGPNTPPTFSRKGSWESNTPRVTVDFEATPDLTIYANFAKGFKPGGLNGQTAITAGRPQDIFFLEEESRTAELGLKATLLERRLQVNVALFKTEVENMQLTTPVNTPTGAITSISSNQGSGEIVGLEVETQFAATDRLRLGFNYALADTEFTEGCDDFQYQLTSGGGTFNPNPLVVSPDFTGRGDCSIVGNAFPLAAKHSGSLTADYRAPVFGGDYELYVNSDLSYTSKKFIQVHGTAYTGDALLLGARFGVETDRWRVGVYGRNLLNEDSSPGATRWFHGYLFGSAATLDPGLPVTGASYSLPRAIFGTLRRERQVGLEANFKF